MNKKLIAAAVSAAIMAPVAAQADVVVYGRINNAIDVVNRDDGDDTTDVSNIVSRFGIKASADVGNGMTASARYEFGTTSDKELSTKGDHLIFGDTRLAYAQLAGAFGSIAIGNQWSAFYDTVGTHIDPTYTLGYYLYSSVVGSPYRSSNTIKYANSFGPVSLELDVRLNDSAEGQDIAEIVNGGDGTGIGLGVSIAASHNVTLALAIDSEDGTPEDTDRVGAAVKVNFDPVFAILGWHQNEIGDLEKEQTQLWLGTNFGEKTTAMIGFGQSEDSITPVEQEMINLGLYHTIGGGMKLYYESVFMDRDGAGDDFDRHLFGMRIDF